MNAIAGGWQLSSIYQIRSGLPFSPFDSANNSGALSGTFRPNQVGNPTSGTCPNGARVGTVDCWFNTSAFAQAPANTFGNTGRNILNGPNWRTVDLALLKDFSLAHLHEGMNAQLKFQATDLFNHPNLGFPDRDIESSGFGQISYANTSRQMQFGMKISF